MSATFNAILTTEVDSKPSSALHHLSDEDLPDGDVTITVAYSSLNYKDGLTLTGALPLIRRYPMVCGVDLAGTVEQSSTPRFRPGVQVVVNGYGLGETHWGGYSQRQRLHSEWLVPIPQAFTLRQAMAIGSAGYAAMLCVMALEDVGITPGEGEVLVTGAAGGVGSVSVALLSAL